MIKKVKQLYYYGTKYQETVNDINTVQYCSPEFDNIKENNMINLEAYAPIVYIGIQTLPGVSLIFNQAYEEMPLTIGMTGIYQLDLQGTSSAIANISITTSSIEMLDEVPTGYLIIDIIYEAEE